MANGLNRDFWIAWVQMCQRLGCDPADLAKVAYCESGLNPAAYNASGPAGGLIQFMLYPLRGCGYKGTVLEFTKLSGLEQLPYVEKYYAPFRAYLTDAGLVYTVNFLPAYAPAVSRALAAGVDYVYAEKQASGYSGVIYKFNTGLDKNGDGKISHSDLLAYISQATSTAGWKAFQRDMDDARAYLQGAQPRPPEHVAQVFNWQLPKNIKQVQWALNWYNLKMAKPHTPLLVDGVLGSETKAAVIAFQAATGLDVDGLPGRYTRARLAERLRQLRVT